MNYITILDFEAGRVFQYEIKELHLNEASLIDGYEVVDHEEFLTNKGHRLKNCEWMIHDSEEIIKE